MKKFIFKIYHNGEWIDLTKYVTDIGLSEEAAEKVPDSFWKEINESVKVS